jgi:hypothetical protein
MLGPIERLKKPLKTGYNRSSEDAFEYMATYSLEKTSYILAIFRHPKICLITRISALPDECGEIVWHTQ